MLQEVECAICYKFHVEMCNNSQWTHNISDAPKKLILWSVLSAIISNIAKFSEKRPKAKPTMNSKSQSIKEKYTMEIKFNLGIEARKDSHA